MVFFFLAYCHVLSVCICQENMHYCSLRILNICIQLMQGKYLKYKELLIRFLKLCDVSL